MITPYYIYIRAREGKERKEGRKEEGRDGIAPDGTKKKESEGIMEKGKR